MFRYRGRDSRQVSMKYRRPRLPEHQPPPTVFSRAAQLLRSLATTSDPIHVAAKLASFFNSDQYSFSSRLRASATSSKRSSSATG
jgi:hypothetical protein